MVAITATVLSFSSRYASDEQKLFYRFGPNDHLKIMGFTIDTKEKYAAVVLYCFMNSMFRTLYNSVLHSWLINNVQDESKKKPKSMTVFAYEATCVTTIYMWFDWYIYMNILLSQLDIVLIEICADLLMSNTVTYYYLKTGPKEDELETASLLTTAP